MKKLPMNCILNNQTRLKIIVLYEPDGIYEMHRGLGDDRTIYITENGNPDNILMWCTQELWDRIFGK